MTSNQAGHSYVSTACQHELCGSCRNTCKFCNAPCRHFCHSQDAKTAPVASVDQARDIAIELLDLSSDLPDELAGRIADDPALFWLRGETIPDGVWREPDQAAGDAE